MKEIKYYRLDSMKATPFSEENTDYITFSRDYLSAHGIIVTNNPKQADLYVRREFPGKKLRLRLALQFPQKPILVWTQEPRMDTNVTKKHSVFGVPDVHIMNNYTGDIRLSNCSIEQPMYPWESENEKKEALELKNRKIAYIATYVPNTERNQLIVNGKNIDLTEYRQNLALYGHNKEMVDIYGKGWPNGISLEDSRAGKWHDRKIKLLQNYDFNICLENTNIDYYCTEKIWDAIRGGSLPIYYGKNNKIYEIFPKDSFIDAADFEIFDTLYKYIEEMDKVEYKKRMAKCIDVYCKCTNKKYLKIERMKSIEKTKNKIYKIIN